MYNNNLPYLDVTHINIRDRFWLVLQFTWLPEPAVFTILLLLNFNNPFWDCKVLSISFKKIMFPHYCGACGLWVWTLSSGGTGPSRGRHEELGLCRLRRLTLTVSPRAGNVVSTSTLYFSYHLNWEIWSTLKLDRTCGETVVQWCFRLLWRNGTEW